MALLLETVYSSLNEAVSQIGSKPITLLIDEPYVARSGCTIPDNVSLLLADNGSIRMPNGVTVTCRGKFTSLTNKKCLLEEGTGRIIFTNGQGLDPALWGAVGDGVTDDAAALNNTIAAVESSNTFNGNAFVDLQGKNYRILSELIPTKYDLNIKGKGMFQSQILFNGVANGCIKPAVGTYFRPIFEDFSMTGDSSSGPGLDLTNITSQVYNGELSRLYITSGGACIKAPGANFFSMKVTTVFGASFNDHAFYVHNGPCVKWENCYAVRCGADKAGYRMAGIIYLDNCNGMSGNGSNITDYWGVFGSDTGGVDDGFINDFPGISYPDITMINCNVEAFVKRGVYVVQSHNHFTWTGGKIDRAPFATAYHSLISLKKNGSTNYPVRLALGQIFKGTGVPDGGAGLTNAWVHCLVGSPIIDMTGAFAAAGITGIYSVPVAGLYPFITDGHAGEAFQNTAFNPSAMMPNRLTCKMVRFQISTVLTPVGAAQAIVVTGFARWTITAAAAASISTATFVATLGVASDYDRNGDLILESTNANLTVNHTALGGAANTFVMAAGANLAMGTGQVIRFLRSITTSQWIQY